jgi:periplasmic protein TonB
MYLEKNVNSTVAADNGAPDGIYTTIIQFVVDKQGNISDVRPLTKHGYGMEAEVMRIITKGPGWIPAMQNGQPVKAYRKQPVTFIVAEGGSKKKRNKNRPD